MLGGMNRLVPMLVLVLLLAGPTVAAQPLDVDALAKQPGTTVTKRTVKGAEVTELRRAGVTITIGPDGETSTDQSGKAVLCLRDMMVAIKITADFCYPGEFTPLSRMLGEQIEAYDRFIVANSPRPVTKEMLERNIAARRDKAAAGIKAAGVPPAQNKVCQQRREEDLLPLSAELEKYRREFRDAIAVPRWPAQNPCL
jgi:hypothetical protein